MSYTYQDLNVKSCTGLNASEKQRLRDLGPLDRFRFIIDDDTEGASISYNAFNISNMDTDIQTKFLEKCYEIRITSSKITLIGTNAFIGISGKKFDCLTCVKIVAPNLTTISRSQLSYLRSKYNQYVSLDLSGCTSLTTIEETAFYYNSFYMLKLPSSITTIKQGAFGYYSGTIELICLDETTYNKYNQFKDTAFTNRKLIDTQVLNTNLGIDNLQITNGIIYGFTPETIKMIVDNPTSHFTLNLSDSTIQGIEYKALDLEYKYGLSNISINIETNLNDNDILLDNTKSIILGLTESGTKKESLVDTNSSFRVVYCPSSALSQVTEIQNLGVNSDLNYIVDLRNLTSLKTINGDNFTPSRQQTLVSLGTNISTIEFTSQIQTPIYLWYPNIQNQVFSNSNINLAIFSPSNTSFVDFVINTNCSQNFGDTILFEGTNASSCAQFTEDQLAVMKEKCIKIEFSENSQITTIDENLFSGFDKTTQIYDKSGKITTLNTNCFATTQSVDTQVTENLANNANASTAFTNRNLTSISFITIPNYTSQFSDFTLDDNNNLIGYTVPENINYERIYITLPQCNYTNQSYTFNDLSNIAYFDMSNMQSISVDATQNILTNQNKLDCIVLNGNITSSLQLANLNTQKETITYVYIKNASPSTDLEALSSTLFNKSQSFINNNYVLKYYDLKITNSEINIKDRALFNNIINYHPIIFSHCHFIVKDTESKQYSVNRNKCSNCRVTFITEYNE